MRVDLDDYVGGATLATELVNTAPGVWSGEDQLDGVPALTRFLAEHGVGTHTRRRSTTSRRCGLCVRPCARRSRRASARAVRPTWPHAPGRWSPGPGGPPALTRDDAGRWRWTVAPRPDATLAERLALLAGVGLLGVLRVLDADRFRDCASPDLLGGLRRHQPRRSTALLHAGPLREPRPRGRAP